MAAAVFPPLPLRVCAGFLLPSGRAVPARPAFLRISRTALRTNCAQTPKHGAENTAICTILRIIRKKCFTNADSRAIFISVIIPVTNIEGGASMPIRKNSKKRQVILEALAATTAHPTAQELYQQLKPDYPDLSLGTVYRNLSLFAEEGDAMSVGVFRGQERFDARTNPHAHLHCVQCGRVIDVPLPGEPEAQLCALAQGVTDAQVLGCSITFTGLCKTCQQADKGSASE